MSERLDLSQLEIQLFAESLDELPAHTDVSGVLCQEMVEEIKDFGLDTVRRALELGILRKRQYHRTPLTNGRYEVLTNFESNRTGKLQRFRITTNKIKVMEMSLYSVESRDFKLAMHSGAVAMRQSTQNIKAAPRDLLEGALPIIWQTNKGYKTRFAGPGYSLEMPRPFAELSFSELSQQLAAARELNSTVSQLSRDLTLEEEYDY